MSKLVSREAMMAVIAHHIDPLQSGTAAFITAIRDIPSVDSGSDLQARYDALQAKVSRESIDGLFCDLDENEGWADDQVEAMQRLRDAILSDTSTPEGGTK